MSRVFAALIRHGDYRQLADTPSAHQPFPLTPAGETQARQAARALCEMIECNGWSLEDRIDSSRMLRAWQTARIIAGHLPGDSVPGMRVESFDALAERGLGAAANLTLDQIRDVIRQDPRFDEPPPDWKSRSDYRLPLQGAESLLEAGRRVAAHLRARMHALTLKAGPARLKLFVGHGAAFRHAAFELGVLSFAQIAGLSMHHASPVVLEYVAGGPWRHVEGQWKVRSGAGMDLD